MINIEELKPKIIEALKPLHLDRVVLFGSYAYGTPNKDSDIDLYVVTSDDLLPQTWREKSDIHLKVTNLLKDISQNYPTDVITHTRAMHKKFVEMDSMFSRKVLQRGVFLV